MRSPSMPTASPPLELDLDFRNGVRRVHGGDGALMNEIRGLFRRIFEHFPLRRGMQQVRIHGKRGLAHLVLRHLDLVGLGELDQVGAGAEIPFAPRGYDLDVRIERVGGELEADLVVALARRPVRDGVRTGFVSDFNESLGNERPRDRGPEQVDPFVDGVRAEHREHEVGDEFLFEIIYVDLPDAQVFRLAPRRFQLLALTKVGGEGHDLRLVLGLQPFQYDGGIEPARIGEHDLVHVLLVHHTRSKEMAARA